MVRRPVPRFRQREPDHSPPAEPPSQLRRGGWLATVLLVPLTIALLVLTVLRLADIDGNQYTVATLALTPYLALSALLLALLSFGLRRRKFAVTLVVIAVSLGALMLPRYFLDEQPPAKGPQVRLMAANLNEGQADAGTIVNAVHDHAVDVLNLLELNQDAATALDAAGLAAELPYRVFDPGVGGHGAGIAARYPVRQIALVESSYLATPSVEVDLPGREDIEVVAVHVLPPMPSNTEIWRRQLAGLPDPAPHVRVRVLAGDFNATFDHAAFRGVVDRGYVDAAEQTGSGLVPTWTTGVSGPPVTLDHVLVDGRCAVRDYAVLDLPGTDHDAVFAEIALP